ncbi:hypothetical protein GQ53DRAFT_743669 [Thozetella sp. PMI_491]|nr:hypothetical protein GQ53DRAFT_743669 [Thozetella sp. PMI_491]
MAAEDKDRFLAAEDSDGESNQGYQSEDEIQKGGRSSKRRRVEVEDDNDSEVDGFSDEEDDEDERNEDLSHASSSKHGPKQATDSAEIQQAEGEEAKDDDAVGGKDGKRELPAEPKVLMKKNLVATEAAIKKSGVVYLSRIPPFMKPHKLRHLLEPYGKINRIFLSPESDEARARRLRGGGNRKKLFTEGWVEFVKKSDAKAVCEILNARTIGGKKGSYYRDDVWTLLYLKGFKWHNLTEQIANENAERASRMRAEISKATKENKAFVRNVEQAKMLDGIKSKAAAKRKRSVPEESAAEEDEAAEEPSTASTKAVKRRFKQTTLAKKRDQREQPEQVSRVLSKIF